VGRGPALRRQQVVAEEAHDAPGIDLRRSPVRPDVPRRVGQPQVGRRLARDGAGVVGGHEAVAQAVDHQQRPADQRRGGGQRAHTPQVDAGEQLSQRQRAGQEAGRQARDPAVLALDHLSEVGEAAVGHQRGDGGFVGRRQQRARRAHAGTQHAHAGMALAAQPVHRPKHVVALAVAVGQACGAAATVAAQVDHQHGQPGVHQPLGQRQRRRLQLAAPAGVLAVHEDHCAARFDGRHPPGGQHGDAAAVARRPGIQRDQPALCRRGGRRATACRGEAPGDGDANHQVGQKAGDEGGENREGEGGQHGGGAGSR
jgi:hypothetical protein